MMRQPVYAWLILVLSCMAARVGAAAPTDTPTTSTLRLADVFQAEGAARGSLVPGAGTFDPQGPVLVIPDYEAWRLPPRTSDPSAGPAELYPLKYDLPKLKLRIAKDTPPTAFLRRVAFNVRGTGMADQGTGKARIILDTRFRQVRTEYRLIPQEESVGGAGSLVLLHGPGTREEFLVPPGQYCLARRMWRAERPDRVIDETYDFQRLESGVTHEFIAGEDTEQDLLARLKDK